MMQDERDRMDQKSKSLAAVVEDLRAGEFGPYGIANCFKYRYGTVIINHWPFSNTDYR